MSRRTQLTCKSPLQLKANDEGALGMRYDEVASQSDGVLDANEK